ncbi:methyltransferase domain-containing protein [Gracilimonas sediminicola]|uniref:Methyltransferase domain-containing protein n=1 Tax=Gracilimonas sediminicola TaxID=2952158 RepID=A0A9X2L2E5_9BACT|nr:methyltransferase domain-containing protein [Gracilimonas sediminicola]
MANRTELSKDETAESYDALASKYDVRWKGYLENTHQKLLGQLRIHPSDRVLDISAGTGYLAKYIQQNDWEFGEFVLNDVSSEMLGKAQEKVGSDDRYRFTGYSAEQMSFETNSFDRVISMNAFHNYPNQEAVIQEVYRVLKPGGMFYLLDWNKEGLFRVVNYWIDKLTSETIQTVSVDDAEALLSSLHFNIKNKQTWHYRYWNLFLITVNKPEQGK